MTAPSHNQAGQCLQPRHPPAGVHSLLVRTGVLGSQGGCQGPSFSCRRTGESPSRRSLWSAGNRHWSGGSRAGEAGWHAGDTVLSPQLGTVCGWKSDHLTQPPDEAPCGGVVEGVSVSAGQGAPILCWPLDLAPTPCGPCGVPGPSLTVPFGQWSPRRLSFSKAQGPCWAGWGPPLE